MSLISAGQPAPPTGPGALAALLLAPAVCVSWVAAAAAAAAAAAGRRRLESTVMVYHLVYFHAQAAICTTQLARAEA
jgi:hypothetical protein